MFPLMAKTRVEESEEEVENDDDEEEEITRKHKITIRVVSPAGGGSRTISSSCAGGSSYLWFCCQADECGADLRLAKRYNRRHRVCERHAKAPVVLLSGTRQRFCQQCSRFHELAMFDDTKRSCRERLASHNERRRKAHADLQHSGSDQQAEQPQGHPSD